MEEKWRLIDAARYMKLVGVREDVAEEQGKVEADDWPLKETGQSRRV